MTILSTFLERIKAGVKPIKILFSEAVKRDIRVIITLQEVMCVRGLAEGVFLSEASYC